MFYRSKKISVLLLALIAPASNVYAEGFYELFEIAKTTDPTYLAGYEQQLAQKEILPQARASLLPSVSGTYSRQSEHSTNASVGSYSSESYGLTLSQPIVNFNYWRTFSQATDTVKVAMLKFQAEEQALMLRVAEEYFDILKAIDELNLASAQKKAFSRHLEQTQQRFNVGLIAITDVHEAKARYDAALAREIEAKNAKANAFEELREIIGREIKYIFPLKRKIDLIPPSPEKIDVWVNTATTQNISLQAERLELDVARKAIKKEQSGHAPTLTLDANINHKNNTPSSGKATMKDVGITLKMPIFNGGGILSKTREVMHLYQKKSQDYEKKYRETESLTRQAYRGVMTQISQVKALKQTVISTQSALKATESAFEVGTRTIVDVLNAQSDLLTAEKNYASARYQYILETLRLKRQAGTLNLDDIKAVNEFFEQSI